MEKLYELHDSGGFDLIVVDTPPTRHALDFLDAPRRLTRLLDNRVFRLLMVPTRGVRCASAASAAQAFLRTISRVVGTEAVDDVVAFFRAFEGMEEGFRDRAGAGDDAARSRRDRVRARHVAAARRGRGGRVLRRPRSPTATSRSTRCREPRAPALLRRRPRGAPRPSPRARGPTRATRRAGSPRSYANLADLEEVAVRERRELAGLEERIGDAVGRPRARARPRRPRLRRAARGRAATSIGCRLAFPP